VPMKSDVESMRGKMWRDVILKDTRVAEMPPMR